MTISVYRDVAAETNQDHRWLRYSDVRMPVTVAEGEAALDLISTKIASIEARLADNPSNEPELTNALNKWGERLAEVEWTTERLRAGEAVPSMDLAKERAAHAETMRKLDAMRVQVKALESKATRLERHRSASDADIIQGLQTQNAGLLRAVEERNATIERLKAAPKQPTPAAPDAREMKRRLIESVHEHCASGLEAFDELRAAGVTLPPISRFIAYKFASALPVGYRAKWKALHLARVEGAAAAFVEPEDGEGGR